MQKRGKGAEERNLQSLKGAGDLDGILGVDHAKEVGEELRPALGELRLEHEEEEVLELVPKEL